MERTTLAAITPAALTAAFNLVYTDYVIPMTVDDESAQRHLASNAIVPEQSLLWRDDDGTTIGLSLLGVRGERGWVGGFGITPAWRGRGLSHELIAATVDQARQLGLLRLQLEVLVQNQRAIATYAQAGFVLQRDLHFLIRPTDLPLPAASGAAVQPADPARLLPHGPRLRPVPPVWQRGQ